MSDKPTVSPGPQAMAEEIEALEYQCDLLTLRLARIETANDECVPMRVVDRLHAGEHPLVVWREYRGIDRSDLAKAAGVGDLELLAIEGGTWEPPLRVAVALALALDVDADDLVPWPQDDGDGAERD